VGKDDQHQDNESDKAPSRSSQGDPDRELELKLRKNPEDLDAKADVGSDESMDASDPSAVTQPGSGGPAPSSSFPEK
jgi:hypothetical protein